MEKNSTLRSPRTLLALLVAVAMVVAALLVVLSQLGGAGGGSGEDVGKLYSGIPQDGTTLGKADAPVSVYLYEDFQCPFCGQFSREMFPRLVDDYVRDGEARLVSETMVFLGPDSVTAARAALAAGEQNHYWPYYSLLYAHQEAENSGYVTDDFYLEVFVVGALCQWCLASAAIMVAALICTTLAARQRHAPTL